MKELSSIDKALNKADVSSRLYIVILIIWKIITKPLKWEFHDGGFGLPHFHYDSCVIIR